MKAMDFIKAHKCCQW